MKKKNGEKTIEEKLKDLDLDEVLEKKRKRKRITLAITIISVVLLFTFIVLYTYFYGNKGYIRADVKVSSSSKLYSNSDEEDIGEGALFIFYIEGIKRDDFLAEYDVTEIIINGEIIDLEKITYRHLNNALSIRVNSENYNLEKGNTVVISVKDKTTGQILTRRLHHKTEVI